MARVTHVKKAQPRFKMVPVIDPATGQQKVTPVMRANGEPKVTKHGRPVLMRQTIADKSQPLELLVCDHCHEPIELGTPYKHVSPKSGPYGGRQRNRHEGCPTWKRYELSNSWSARVEGALDGAFSASDCDSDDAVTEQLSTIAESIRELAQESEEVADNVENGFGHETQTSMEARERAEALEGFADEIENASFTEFPDPEPVERYFVVNGDGDVALGDEENGFEEEQEAQDAIDAHVKEHGDEDELSIEPRDVEAEELSEDELSTWQETVQGEVDEVLGNSPV